VSERFKGRGKLLKLGAPPSAAIDVEFAFAVRQSAGATAGPTVVIIGGGAPFDCGHYTAITRDDHRHQAMNLGDAWQLRSPPGSARLSHSEEHQQRRGAGNPLVDRRPSRQVACDIARSFVEALIATFTNLSHLVRMGARSGGLT
jgi:hypothetical protein